MGGHQSKQSVNEIQQVVTNAVMTTTQNCIGLAQGTQFIGVFGDGNIVSENTQNLTLSFKSDCINTMDQSGSYETDLSSQLSQSLQDQTVAMTQWADNSKSSNSANISQYITTNINISNVQNCLSTLQGSQIITVRGNNNVVTKNAQNQVASMVGDCLMSGSQQSSSTATVADVINQKSQYKEENPMSFLTDALKGLGGNVMMILVVIFVVLIVIGIAYKMLTSEGKDVHDSDDDKRDTSPRASSELSQ